MTVTQWFSYRDKPVYLGVYQRQWADEITYSYWNGKNWLWSAQNPNDAIYAFALSNTQIADWRGLVKLCP